MQGVAELRAAGEPRTLRQQVPSAERLPLPRGQSVVVRPIRPGDAAALQAMVERLSPRSRLLRFHLALNGLSDALAHQLTDVDQRGDLALVAEAIGADGAPQLVADARYVVQEDGRTGEFGIMVADDWNGRGLGRALMAKLLLWARQRGLQRLVGEVLTRNRRMQVLVQGLGGRIRSHPDEESLVIAEFTLRS